MAFHERENDAAAIQWGEEHGSCNGTAVSPKGLGYYESAVSCASSYSSWSDLSSPFGSELESTTESEEDEEFISELTRKMAESMLQDDDEEDDGPKQQAVQDPEAGVLPVNWSESGSKSGSVCYSYNSNHGFMSKSGKPKIETVSNVNSDENSADEYVNELKRQEDGGGRPVMAADTASLPQREKQSAQNRGGGGGGRGWKHGGQGKKSSIPVFPAPQVGSGMRAVFLGGSDRNGCSGTGVFLPTGGGYAKPEPKRKSGCSTVLIPARVLQTLQQHFNTVGAPSPSNSTGGTPDLPWRNDVLARINGLLSQKREHAEFHSLPRPPATYSAVVEASHHPVVPDLPQEWTY